MSTQKTYSSAREIAEIWKLFRETKLQAKEDNRQLKEKFREVSEQMKDTDRRMKELQNLFTTQWGKLIEALTEGGLVSALKERNIKVIRLFPNVEVAYEDGRREFDIIAANGREVVVVEAKTTLSKRKVQWFLKNMKNFKTYFPEYKDKKVYGAVAFLKSDRKASCYAEEQGLFVLNPVGNVVKVINAPNFRPKPIA